MFANLEHLSPLERQTIDILKENMPHAFFIGVKIGPSCGIGSPVIAYFKIDAFTEISINITDYDSW